MSTFCVLMYPPSLNLKTVLPIARTWIRWITPYGMLYSSLFTDSSGNKLGTSQPHLYWSGNRTVSKTISLNHFSEERPCWTFFWLAVWILSACYISFAYVCDVYDITNGNETFYLILPHPVDIIILFGDCKATRRILILPNSHINPLLKSLSQLPTPQRPDSVINTHSSSFDIGAGSTQFVYLPSHSESLQPVHAD